MAGVYGHIRCGHRPRVGGESRLADLCVDQLRIRSANAMDWPFESRLAADRRFDSLRYGFLVRNSQ